MSRPDQPLAAGKIVGYLPGAADAAAEIVSRGKDAWQQDRLLRLAGEAVIRRIGDAAAKLPEQVQAAMPAVPWDDIRANRILVADIYHRIDYEILWETSRGMCQALHHKSRRGGTRKSLQPRSGSPGTERSPCRAT